MVGVEFVKQRAEHCSRATIGSNPAKADAQDKESQDYHKSIGNVESARLHLVVNENVTRVDKYSAQFKHKAELRQIPEESVNVQTLENTIADDCVVSEHLPGQWVIFTAEEVRKIWEYLHKVQHKYTVDDEEALVEKCGKLLDGEHFHLLERSGDERLLKEDHAVELQPGRHGCKHHSKYAARVIELVTLL